ncbi:MAG: NTP transferase domain-containing protein [Candidatus Eisenbacteria bacterium]|uniref:NTP transferase domain-containing protein n=1 Tax=Eiseniibacteriota bacterium TaxID=2212470 RepID=A0A956M1F6_UNCEI|nr:NTP transferase domain-containing protein [Candidatus Eisenbacteria bacterium]
MSKKLSAILLSRPLGQGRTPKMLLPFGDETVLARTLKAYQGFDEVLVVVPGSGDGVDAAIQSSGIAARSIAVADAEAGLGEQLRAALDAASSSTQGYAIGMTDQPILSSELVTDIRSRFEGGKAKILAPVCQRAIGLPTFFDSEMRKELSSLSAHGTLWDVFKAHGDDVDACELFHTAVLGGIEDTDDYHALLRLAGLPVPEPEEEGAIPSTNGGPSA